MHFVIAGKANCPQFAFATMIIQRLKDSLPEFTYERISKKSGDWEKWLVKTCQENEWYHTKSPIIWREISMTKGKKYLIGDITKFLDLCQDHYGFKRDMIRAVHLEKKEIQWFAKRSEMDYTEDVKKKAEEHLAYRCRQVAILGAACHASDVLIMELLHIPLQNRENGLEIRLFDEPHREKRLWAIAEDAKHCLGYSGLGSCRVATTLKEALYNVDLVIVLDSFPRRPNESLVKWLKRNRNAMCVLGIALNRYARAHCRVIIGGPSNQPICYNATVIANFATKLHVRNIVVVTQDLGRETLAHLAKRRGLDMKDLNCPPVWGFVGLNKYVDLRNTLQTYAYKVPGPRMSKNLSQGSEELEIRTIDPFLEKDDINGVAVAVISHKEKSLPRLGRITQLAKITAIVDLLKVWGLKQEDGSGEILSLGVYSDGTFNIPEGLYWSQPVTLEKGFWKPYGRFPIPRKLDINLHSLFLLGITSLASTDVKRRKQRDPKPVCKRKESNKFDLNALGDAVKLPVVRTKAECLEVLKRLLVQEGGIDATRPKSRTTITEVSEESSIETVPQEKIYCECWRQELLQLRKMATDKSSVTEVEVDLSENLSGSEWSVVNPPDAYVASEESLPSGSVVLKPEKSSICAVVCDCGPECHCLTPTTQGDKSREKSMEDTDEESTEHFYKHQDATVYVQDDVKDILYEDLYKKKEVQFDPKLGRCADKSKKKYKFYGTKDAIVDEEKREKMLMRIRKYEDGEGRGEETGEAEYSSSADGEEYIFFAQKFHLSVDENFEIVGDPEGLEALEELRKSGQKEPSDDFTEMWADEVTPALQVLSASSETMSTSVEISEPREISSEKVTIAPEDDFGEGGVTEIYQEDSRFKSNLEAIPEVEVEEEVDESVVGEILDYEKREEKAHVEVETGDGAAADVKAEDEANVGVKPPEPAKKRKWEGIPKCCLCFCIVPEGELGCSCGEKRVMEVFREEYGEAGESARSLIESICTPSEETLAPEYEREEEEEMKEDEKEEREQLTPTEEEEQEDLDLEERRKEVKVADELESWDYEEEEEMEEEQPTERKKRDINNLPPESFFPFTPKRLNKFVPSESPKPVEADQRSIFEDLPPECLQMLEDAKANVENIVQREDEERATRKACGEDDLVFELEDGNIMLEMSAPRQYRVEDWTKVLKKKYREWFETAKKIPDEFYYDAAAEDPSDEECEVDKELSQYFED